MGHDQNLDLRDVGEGPSFMRFLREAWVGVQHDAAAGLMPPSVFGLGACAHPAALVKLTDAIATCDGCGRVFELKDFGPRAREEVR